MSTQAARQEIPIALAASLYVLCAAAVGSRIFAGTGSIPPNLSANLVLIGVTEAVFLAALALGIWRRVAALISAIGLGITLTHQFAPGTHWYGLPTTETWDLLRAQLGEAGAEFATAVAPVPHGQGWDLMFALGYAVVIASTILFGQARRAPTATLVPGAGFFIGVSVLGQGSGGLLIAAALVASGYLLAATLRGSLHLGISRLLLSGASLGIIGALAVPLLPGADQEPWITTRGRFGSLDQRISPLVDLQARLVNQSRVELFEIRSTEPGYWRVVTLTEFDGRRFTISPAPAEGPESQGSDDPRREFPSGLRTPGLRAVDQTITVSALDGDLVPTAAVPIAATVSPGEPVDPATDEVEEPIGLRWRADISAVQVLGRGLRAGDSLQVRSAVPSFRLAELAGRTALRPPDPAHLSLPDDFPDSVTTLAAQILAAAAPGIGADPALQPYAVARALQDWFRTEFTYSLEIPAGHGTNALIRFLEDRVGYCEQFAAAFVAMARSQGIPSRVAVGYTPGLQREPGVYTVQGRHAHAWPEVWFDGIGWVPFEPTPGRGLPGSEEHTGLPAQQDGPLGVPEAGADQSEGFDALDGIAELTEDPFTEDLPLELGPEDPGPVQDATGSPWTARTIFGIGLPLAGLLLAGPSIWRWFRRRRLGRLEPADEVVAMWRTRVRALRRQGFLPDRSLTVTEICAVVTARSVGLGAPVATLASAAVRVGFSRTLDLDTNELRDCRAAAAEIDRILRGRRGGLPRLIDYYAVWRDVPITA